MTNATMTAFGHPRTLIGESAWWSVQLRPKQPTLGSLALICKEPARAFGDISPEAFADLKVQSARIEAVLRDFVAYERINYLMLMMVDPDVHFHVIPRYDTAREFEGVTFADAGWPGPPALGQAVEPGAEVEAKLIAALKSRWTAAA